MPTYDVIVLGGGILGVSLTFYLQQQGRSVLLIDDKRIGGGATGNGFAWINATSKIQDRNLCSNRHIRWHYLPKREHRQGSALSLHG